MSIFMFKASVPGYGKSKGVTQFFRRNTGYRLCLLLAVNGALFTSTVSALESPEVIFMDQFESYACNDEFDADGDGFLGYPMDPGCTSPIDKDEADDCPSGPGCAQCANSVDDDGDNLVDYPDDPGCTAASDSNEIGTFACADEFDTDGDGFPGFPTDPGCTDLTDNDEVDDCPSGPGCAECANHLDDDGDGLVDYLSDPECASASDLSELNL